MKIYEHLQEITENQVFQEIGIFCQKKKPPGATDTPRHLVQKPVQNRASKSRTHLFPNELGKVLVVSRALF